MESSARHPRNSCRQGNESSNHRKQPSNEYRQISPAPEEPVRPVKLAAAHENPAAIALDQWTTAVTSDFVCHQRSQIAPDRPRSRRPKQLECPLKHQVS